MGYLTFVELLSWDPKYLRTEKKEVLNRNQYMVDRGFIIYFHKILKMSKPFSEKSISLSFTCPGSVLTPRHKLLTDTGYTDYVSPFLISSFLTQCLPGLRPRIPHTFWNGKWGRSLKIHLFTTLENLNFPNVV